MELAASAATANLYENIPMSNVINEVHFVEAFTNEEGIFEKNYQKSERVRIAYFARVRELKNASNNGWYK